MRTKQKKIRYCVNHDDLMFLKDRAVEGKQNVPMAVFADIFREAARLYELYGGRSCDSFKVAPHPTGAIRVEFLYQPIEVIKEYHPSNEEICAAMVDMCKLGLVFVYAQEDKSKLEWWVSLFPLFPSKLPEPKAKPIKGVVS